MQGIADLIKQCQLQDPNKRPTAKDVLRRIRAETYAPASSRGSTEYNY